MWALQERARIARCRRGVLLLLQQLLLWCGVGDRLVVFFVARIDGVRLQ
jgi:hypothetical protein